MFLEAISALPKYEVICNNKMYVVSRGKQKKGENYFTIFYEMLRAHKFSRLPDPITGRKSTDYVCVVMRPEQRQALFSTGPALAINRKMPCTCKYGAALFISDTGEIISLLSPKIYKYKR